MLHKLEKKMTQGLKLAASVEKRGVFGAAVKKVKSLSSKGKRKLARKADASSGEPVKMEAYRAAIGDPFSTAARGARVPDLYSFPTTTYRLQTSMLLGAGQTAFGATFYPNPYFTVVDTGLSNGATGSIDSRGGMKTGVGMTAINAFTTSTIFAPLATGFRVVGGGIRIRNLLPELTATGRIYIAVVPVARGGVPSTNAINVVTPTADTYLVLNQRLGMPSPATCASSALQLLPISKDYTVGQIVGSKEIDVFFPVFHPDIYSFKPTVAPPGISTTLSLTDEVLYNTSTGAINTLGGSGNKENTQCDGSAGIIMWCEGFPAAATSQIEVDVVLHLECTPFVVGGTSLSSGMAPEADAPPITHVGSTAVVEHEIAIVRNDPDNIIAEVDSTKGAGGARIAH